MIIAPIVIALMTPIAGQEAPPAFSLIPVQLSMPRKIPPSTAAAGIRPSAPAQPRGGTAQEGDRRLAEALNRLSPKERKQLAKAMKRLSPEKRRQVTEALKRQLAGRGTAAR